MSILNYEATSDDGFGNIEKVTAQTEPSKARFNPMQSWMNASKVIDQEFSRPAAQTFAANVPQNIQPYSEYGGTSAETFGLGREPVVAPYAQTQNFPYPEQLQMDGRMTPQEMAYQNSWQRPHEPDMDYMPDPTALGFPNIPYDVSIPQDFPSEAPGALPQGDGYTRPMTPEMLPFGSMDVTGGMTADQQMDTGGMVPVETPFDDDWMRAQEQAGNNPDQTQRLNAVIQTASMQNDGTNTAGGMDASQDPVMKQRLGPLASDPAKRREAYMKRLNTAFMQSIALDAMASALGVPSRASAFMEMTQKAIDAEMKFDDEERLAEINRAVFFPNGVYDPPANAREAFDRAIRANATPEEAAAISGHLPEGEEIGFDTYYKERPDGGVETIYVPKGQAPPPGSTPASGVATHNADLLAPEGSGSTPTDIAVPQEIMRLEAEAKKDEEAGNAVEAQRKRTLADMIRQKAFGSRSNVLADKRVLFDSLFGQYYKAPPDRPGKVPQPFFALPSRTESGEVIPESEREPLTKDDLFWLFSNSPDVIDVYDRQGKLIQINPYSSFNSPNTGMNPYPKDVSINILRANPDMETLQQFVDVYGAEALPREFA